MSADQPKIETERPVIRDDKLVLYVKKASPTSTANAVKPLIMIEALSIPHDIHVITSTGNQHWFHDINPYRMVPALEDVEVYQNSDGKSQRLNVFDSSACLAYLAEKHDKDGLYAGRTPQERAVVTSWLMSYTAGLGATGKWWLLLRMPRLVDIADALQLFVKSIKHEYGSLERRLERPGQLFVALADRPTIADFAILPLANNNVAATAGIDLAEWPKLKEWSERVSALPPVARALRRIARFGLSEEELSQLGLEG